MRARLYLLTAVACAQLGCASTQISFVVEVDQGVAARATRVLIEVRTQEGELALSEQITLLETPLPIQRLVAPRGGDASREVTFSAIAVDGDSNPIATARLRRRFAPRQTVEARLRLYDSCIGVQCNQTQTCDAEGECVEVESESVPDAGLWDGTVTGDAGVVSAECAAGFTPCLEAGGHCCATGTNPWVLTELAANGPAELAVGGSEGVVILSGNAAGTASFSPPVFAPVPFPQRLSHFAYLWDPAPYPILSAQRTLYALRNGQWSTLSAFTEIPERLSVVYSSLAWSPDGHVHAVLHYDDDVNWNLEYTRVVDGVVQPHQRLVQSPTFIDGGLWPLIAVDGAGGVHVMLGNRERVLGVGDFVLPANVDTGLFFNNSTPVLPDGRILLVLGADLYAGGSGVWERLPRCGEPRQNRLFVDRSGVLHFIENAGPLVIYRRLDLSEGICTEETISTYRVDGARSDTFLTLSVGVTDDRRVHVVWSRSIDAAGVTTRQVMYATRPPH